jgi:hypothetical protein
MVHGPFRRAGEQHQFALVDPACPLLGVVEQQDLGVRGSDGSRRGEDRDQRQKGVSHAIIGSGR